MSAPLRILMNPQGWPAGSYFGESLEYGGKSSVTQGRGERNGQIGWGTSIAFLVAFRGSEFPWERNSPEWRPCLHPDARATIYSTQQLEKVHVLPMKWTPPQYDGREVNKAGNCLITTDGVVSIMDRNHMLEVINNWRAAHGFPLQCMKMTLLNRARKIDAKAIVAQRLKRLSSIDAKLQQHSDWMKLTQMQDIGGCRAIVDNIRRLKRLIRVYKKSASKNPTKRHVLQKPND